MQLTLIHVCLDFIGQPDLASAVQALLPVGSLATITPTLSPAAITTSSILTTVLFVVFLIQLGLLVHQPQWLSVALVVFISTATIVPHVTLCTLHG